MKTGVPLITVVCVSLALIIWVVVFRLGGLPGVSTVTEPTAATLPDPPPATPKPQPKPVKHVVAEASEPPPAVVAPVGAPVAMPAPQPELPVPDINDVPVGSSRRELLSDFHKPALQATSAVRGTLFETYVYSPEKDGRDMFVVLRDGHVAAKYDVAHDQ